MTDKQNNTEKPDIDIHEVFRHYRTTASIFAATIIGLSSVVIIFILTKLLDADQAKTIWLEQSLYILAIIAFSASILFGIRVQYFIFRGYHNWSTFLIEKYGAPKDAGGKHNTDFTKADDAAKYSCRAFVITFIIALVILCFFLMCKLCSSCP